MLTVNELNRCANCKGRNNCDWLVCQAIIEYWLPRKGVTLAAFLKSMGYTNPAIESRIKNGWPLPSDLLHDLFDNLGLQTASRAKLEDTVDLLPDYECRLLISEPYIQNTP